jgi:hypothetical protein
MEDIDALLDRQDIARLSALTHNRPCIVFNRRQGQIEVNRAESLKLIRIAMRQETSARALIGGKIVMVYPAENMTSGPTMPAQYPDQY